MTALWGPLGWMTLHSVSLLYPEVPSNADKQIVKRFMILFQDTISCPSCHQHFKVIFENYVRIHPHWADSRFNFFLFVAIAHNTVNKRLNKPRPDSVQACLDMFANNTKVTSAAVYRQKYMEYLARNWGRELSGEGMMRIAEVRELRRIMNEYWNTKTDESTATFKKSASVLDLIDETPEFRSIMTPAGSLAQVSSQSMKIGLQGGRFRIRQ
jgi:hypothetical protein